MDNFNNEEILRQINHHMPIEGYRIFSEEKTGNHYAVVLLSKNNKRCVLAEINNISNSQDLIKIISFGGKEKC